MRDDDISYKTNKILNLFLLALILILIRVWFLAVVQNEDQKLLSSKPRRKAIVEKVDRGTIRDRYNLSLAENRIQYSAAICYADIKEIPVSIWGASEGGKRIKIPKRKEHITALSTLLGSILNKDPLEIEDIIYGKAALFPQLPFVIKEGISEKEYFKLRALEKDWQGIRAQRESKRVYPLGKTACDVIGYMGSISEGEYKTIALQIKELEHYIEQREEGETPMLPKGFEDPAEVRAHLSYLKERAYRIQDFVGKSGIEAKCDKELRGVYGKTYYEIDTKGNSLRTLPGSKPASSPRRVLLTLSAELQAYAEELLAEREKDRDSTTDIKGGAIVAMDPNTGEILALASYPRFSPEDFIPSFDPLEKNSKNQSIGKWLETELYLGNIWDGQKALEKENFAKSKGFYIQEEFLSWRLFLSKALSPKSALFRAMQSIQTLKEAWVLQDSFDKLRELASFKEPKELLHALYTEEGFLENQLDELSSIRKDLDPILQSIPSDTDKLLCIDLCHLILPKEKIDPQYLEFFGDYSLDDYNLIRQELSSIKKELQKKARLFFHQTLFQNWRTDHFKEFLKKKRKEEENAGTYAKPYTEYLEHEETKQFHALWDKQKHLILEALLFQDTKLDTFFAALFLEHLKDTHWECAKIASYFNQLDFNAKRCLLHSMRSFQDLERPLLGKYRHVRSYKQRQLEKHLAESFYPYSGYGYVRSTAFRQATPQGSVFKLVVAYEALRKRFETLKTWDLNPLTLTDRVEWGKDGPTKILGYTSDGKPITRVYKGGKLPRSHSGNIGTVNLIGAIEQSSNIYFSLLASDVIDSPLDLLETTRALSFGKKTQIDLPGEIAGKVPEDINYNKTGLYAFAIGQHSLVVTPLQTAVMLSSIANGGSVLKPQIIKLIAAKEMGKHQSPFSYPGEFPFEHDLGLVGLHFPVFSETLPQEKQSYFETKQAEIKNSLFLPTEIREMLLQGMEQVIKGSRGTARPSASLQALCSRAAYQDFLDLQNELVCKTGTAEILVKPTIDAESKAVIQNQTWFAGIAFESADGHTQKWDNPEIVVIVFLRDGTLGGKEGAPIAGQIIKKWRHIKQKHGQ